MLLFSQAVHSREDQVRENYHMISFWLLGSRTPFHPYKAKLPFLYRRRSLSVHAASQN